MHSQYNRVAGQSVERLAALSDGIFAVSMTLLVLDLRVPAREVPFIPSTISGTPSSCSRLVSLVFLMSVMTNGIFWVGQQTQLNQFARSDRNLAWIHIAFLCAITLTPFTTSLLAEFIHYRVALLIYWFNIVLLGAMTLLLELAATPPAPIFSSDDAAPEIHPASHPPHRNRAVALRRRRRPLFFQHLLQHRRHCSGADKLRHRPQILLGTVLEQSRQGSGVIS
jgi:uncharacterized membrane protein